MVGIWASCLSKLCTDLFCTDDPFSQRSILSAINVLTALIFCQGARELSEISWSWSFMAHRVSSGVLSTWYPVGVSRCWYASPSFIGRMGLLCIRRSVSQYSHSPFVHPLYTRNTISRHPIPFSTCQKELVNLFYSFEQYHSVSVLFLPIFYIFSECRLAAVIEDFLFNCS